MLENPLVLILNKRNLQNEIVYVEDPDANINQVNPLAFSNPLNVAFFCLLLSW